MMSAFLLIQLFPILSLFSFAIAQPLAVIEVNLDS